MEQNLKLINSNGKLLPNLFFLSLSYVMTYLSHYYTTRYYILHKYLKPIHVTSS